MTGAAGLGPGTGRGDPAEQSAEGLGEQSAEGLGEQSAEGLGEQSAEGLGEQSAEGLGEQSGGDGTEGRFGRLRTDVAALVEQQLFPAAAEVDRSDLVPRANLRALAELGLHGMAVPTERGGLGLTGSQLRQVLRLLGSGCGATAFSFAQHLGTSAAVATTANHPLRDRWLPGLVDDVLSGTAYAHLRRPGTPALRAVAAGDRWRFVGVAPWVSSWGTAEVVSMAARSDDGRIVWALVEATEGSGLAVDRTFELVVFRATRTVALSVDLDIGPESVLSDQVADEWLEVDRALAVRPNPLCLGVGDRAMALLDDTAPVEAARRRARWDDLAGRAEEASDLVDRKQGQPAEVASIRAEVLTEVQGLTAALLAVAGGGAMVVDHPAQRLAREAAFFIVQAQNADGRRAFLDRLDHGRNAPS